MHPLKDLSEFPQNAYQCPLKILIGFLSGFTFLSVFSLHFLQDWQMYFCRILIEFLTILIRNTSWFSSEPLQGSYKILCWIYNRFHAGFSSEFSQKISQKSSWNSHRNLSGFAQNSNQITSDLMWSEGFSLKSSASIRIHSSLVSTFH